jgi:hypothetical protein
MTGPAAGPVALIAGTGALPRLMAEAARKAGRSSLVAALQGFPVEGLTPDIEFRVERLVPFLRTLAERGVSQVVFAGAVHRPQLDPALFDPDTAALVPRILPALNRGDDQLLREVIALFEEAGLPVAGVADIAPDLVPAAGILGAVQPGETDRADAARAAEILAATGALDIGQGAVVAQGLCLGLEALPGTDALLRGVAAMDPGRRPDPAKGRGLLYKAPKPGQDRRIDLPAMGLRTVELAAEAGLGGLGFEASGVLLLDRAAMVARADELGLFLWARQP